jgi:hypothetical protein
MNGNTVSYKVQYAVIATRTTGRLVMLDEYHVLTGHSV